MHLHEVEQHITVSSGMTYWGKAGSGLLPIALDTKNVCLNLRSANVTSIVNGQRSYRRCWGTFGGALDERLTPEQNAIEELKQETGYTGSIQLYPAFVYQDGSFRYYNFLGAISEQLSLKFAPHADSAWESEGINWFPLEEIVNRSSVAGIPFHDGLTALLSDTRSIQAIYHALRRENQQESVNSFLSLFTKG